MNMNELYDVVVKIDKTGFTEIMTIEVKEGRNIVECIEAKMAGPFKIIKIINITRNFKCIGCQCNKPGQRSHMEHPDGCLHKPDLCDMCG